MSTDFDKLCRSIYFAYRTVDDPIVLKHQIRSIIGEENVSIVEKEIQEMQREKNS